MAEKITLILSQAEARALNALAQAGADRMILGLSRPVAHLPKGWSKTTAARACDKLQHAILPGLPDECSLRGLLQEMAENRK
jgi:hypothetical protein